MKKLVDGYRSFRDKFHSDDNSVMEQLSQGQKPEVMVVACCDSRVDPAILLQCNPGDLFVVRNVANIVPPFEQDDSHHGTSAALEYAVCYLKIRHLVILGHSQCGGIDALLNDENLTQNDFISNWVSLASTEGPSELKVDEQAKKSLLSSKQNCLTFPWIKQRVENNELMIHSWFFNIKTADIMAFSEEKNDFVKLEEIGIR